MLEKLGCHELLCCKDLKSKMTKIPNSEKIQIGMSLIKWQNQKLVKRFLITSKIKEIINVI